MSCAFCCHFCLTLSLRNVTNNKASFLQLLHAQRVKTSVGFCYIDIPAVCPPKIVTVPAANLTANAKLILNNHSTTRNHAHDDVDAFTDKFGVPATASSTDYDTSTDKSTTAAIADPTTASTVSSCDRTLSIPPFLQPTLEVNDMFAIRPSALGGMGCFALRDIYRGDHLLVERPLLRTNLLHLFHELERLTPAQRAQYDALHAWHPDPRASRAEQIWTANTFVAGELEGLFVVASRFNHACSLSPKQNVGYRYDRQHNVLVMTAVARIAVGTELLISYGKSAQMLKDRFGFTCGCGACETSGESSTKLLTADELYKRMWS